MLSWVVGVSPSASGDGVDRLTIAPMASHVFWFEGAGRSEKVNLDDRGSKKQWNEIGVLLCPTPPSFCFFFFVITYPNFFFPFLVSGKNMLKITKSHKREEMGHSHVPKNLQE